VRAHYDSVRRRHTEDAFTMIDGRLVPEGSATQVTAANRSASYALALHALDAVSWQRLTVTPGVRLELIHSRTEDALTAEAGRGFVAALLPGAGLYYAASDAFGLLAGVHRGFSPPPPASDEHVKPESSTNYELGGRFNASGIRAEWIGFYNHYTNLTDLCTLSSGCLSEDLDRQFDAG
jgi:Fe(3+) dicitrate transport protein